MAIPTDERPVTLTDERHRALREFLNGQLIPGSKVFDYALNPSHPTGGGKARVFKSALGFDQTNARRLVDQLREGVRSHAPELGVQDQFGTRYIVDVPVNGLNGKTAIVRTSWIFRPGSDVPQLITLYVR